MNGERAGVGPVQLLILGFDTAENFRGEVARELLALRGRGMIRVLDARLLHRTPDGELTEVDLGPLVADWPDDRANAVAGLLAANGNVGNGGPPSPPGPPGGGGVAPFPLPPLSGGKPPPPPPGPDPLPHP